MTIPYDKSQAHGLTTLERIDLVERYLSEKHNYSLDEIVEICNKMKHGEYLVDVLAAEVYKIEGTLETMNAWIKREIDDEEDTLKETLD